MSIEFRENSCDTVTGIIEDNGYGGVYPYADIEISDGYEISINDARLTYEELEQK